MPARRRYLTPAHLPRPQEKGEFQHVIRILNTNVEGKRTVLYALTKIKVRPTFHEECRPTDGA